MNESSLNKYPHFKQLLLKLILDSLNWIKIEEFEEIVITDTQ